MILLIISTILNFYTNDVVIKRADSTITPYLGMNIESNDTIIVKDSSKAEILYPDSSTLFIDENSRIATTGGRKRSVFLYIGKIWAKVTSLLRDESYEVKNPISVSGVRGTEFNISYRDGESEIMVIDGELDVKQIDTEEEVILEKEDMAQIRKGMLMKVKKFKLKEIKRWNKWRENHLKFIINKIKRSIEKGEIIKTSLLIEQGYALAARLGLRDEYDSRINELKEEYMEMRKKQGTINDEINDIRYSLRKVDPLLSRIEPNIMDLRKMMDHLVEERKALIEFIETDRKIEAIQMLYSMKFLSDRIDIGISRMPLRLLNTTLKQIDSEYVKTKEMLSEKGLSSETELKIKNLLDRIDEQRDRTRRLKSTFDNIVYEYNKIKEEISRLKRKI